MSKNNKQVIVTKPSALAPWADRAEVRDLAERLRATMPGAQKLTPEEALTLAQAALAHGLDPLNGELWYLKNKDGTPLGLMAGIKGHRRGAHLQMEREGGGNYWPEFDGPLGPDQKISLGIPPEALAYRCKVRDTQTVEHYTGQIERLLKAGLPWEVVSDIVGSRPYTEGVGYALKSEFSKMTLVQRAMKRAEADALKRRFDLPFGSAVGMSGDVDTVDAEFITTGNGEYLDQKTVEDAEEELKNDLEKGRETLRGTAGEQAGDLTEQRPYPPDKIRRGIMLRVKQASDVHHTTIATPGQRGLVCGKLKQCFDGRPDVDHDIARHVCLGYLFAEVLGDGFSSKDLTVAQASATLDWLVKATVEDKHALAPYAALEAQGILGGNIPLKEAEDVASELGAEESPQLSLPE